MNITTIKGWDKETSLQNKEKLEELDLQDVALVLAEEEGLACGHS